MKYDLYEYPISLTSECAVWFCKVWGRIKTMLWWNVNFITSGQSELTFYSEAQTLISVWMLLSGITNTFVYLFDVSHNLLINFFFIYLFCQRQCFGNWICFHLQSCFRVGTVISVFSAVITITQPHPSDHIPHCLTMKPYMHHEHCVYSKKISNQVIDKAQKIASDTCNTFFRT